MFYSHEVLTSRKYGVATVWLVATLGSRTSLKKVSRKAILEVDVSKACETISEPDAPMALRLQSNLLYGVTRVYSQQCGYVLADVEAVRNGMRAVIKALRTSSLDLVDENRGRTERLILRDDPNFLPELDFALADLDLTDPDGPSPMRALGTLSSHRSPSDRYHSISSQQGVGGLVFPSGSGSSFAGPSLGSGLSRLRQFESPTVGSAGRRDFFAQDAFEGLQDDLGLIVGDDGNIVMQDSPDRGADSRPAAVQAEETGMNQYGMDQNMDIEQMSEQLPQTNIQDDFLPPAEEGTVENQLSDGQAVTYADTGVQTTTTSETATASLQPARRRQRNPLPVDDSTELHTRELKRWDQEYIGNMRKDMQLKGTAYIKALAKVNAEYWVLKTGQQTGGPFDDLPGMGLLEAFTGIALNGVGAKRAREQSQSSESERRVRSRGEPSSDEFGRGDGLQDDGFMPPTFEEEIEQGRERPTPLDDLHQSSMFPWNQSAGSRRPTALFGTAVSSSAGGGVAFPPISRHGSRLTSASPLQGRGSQMAPEHEIPTFEPEACLDDLGITGDDEFQMYGPAAQVDTQTAAQSQWVKSALDSESLNFLAFVEGAIHERYGTQEEVQPDVTGNSTSRSITLDSLLPPGDNSTVVAAQGFLHLLALGSKDLLMIEQDEVFGPIAFQRK